MGIVRLLSWNVNGIRAVHRKGALFEVFKDSPHVVCLQETKSQEEQLVDDIKDINGYHSHFVSAERKGYSGVAVYSRIMPQEVRGGMGIEKFDMEGRIIAAEYKTFTLLNVYFPNGKASKERLQYKLDFYDAFLDFAESIRNEGKHVVICGDVNTAHKEIDLARPKENENTSGFLPIEREWIDKFLDKGYVDTLRVFNDQPGQYSWWDYKTRARDRNVGWRIDYFYINQELAPSLKAASIHPEVMGSDHCPVSIDLEVEAL